MAAKKGKGKNVFKSAMKNVKKISKAKDRKSKAKPKGKGKGFKAAKNDVAKKQGVSEEEASAIVADAARNASPEAKMENPNLNKVI